MSIEIVGAVALLLLLILMFIGTRLYIALMVVSVVTLFLSLGDFGIALKVLGSTSYSAISEYTFGVIPLFVLMGMFANLSGASTELYDAANAFSRKIKGGLAVATVIANAVFAAITGASIASAAVFTKIAVPQMTRLGYDKKLSVGTVAGSSILGMLIPPSILMIVYGTLAEVSIGKLFIAGVLPGILMTIVFIIFIIALVLKNPVLAGHDPSVDFSEEKSKWFHLSRTWAILLLLIVTLGGIWVGFFTPTEAGGVGAFGAFILVIVKGKLNFKVLWKTLLKTGVTAGSVLILLISAQMYSRALAISGIINLINGIVTSLNVPNIVVVLIFMGILVILGCILDSTSILLLTMPIMTPIVKGFGMDLIWFGIIAIVAIETGLITPPFGLGVYTVKTSLNDIEGFYNFRVEDIFRGAAPFLVAMIVVLAILIFFPSISTYLVTLM